MAPVDLSYLVCATPRSGSTLLCELLSATGVAGRPQEYFEHLYATGLPRQPREYFEGVEDPQVLALLPPSDPGEPESTEAFERRLMDALREGTTPNGVWSSKMMWGYLLDLLRRLRERPQTAELKPHEALATVFPGLRYVFVKRQDKVAQAVSLWTAVQTAQWRDEGDDAVEHAPEYSRAGIEHLVEQLTVQERAWATWFRSAGVEPHVVTYEELVTNQQETIHDVLRSLHIDAHGIEVPEPRMRRQASDRSREWAERYELERQVAA